MTATLTVRIGDFVQASSLVSGVADVVAAAGDQLCGQLPDTAGMAGSDPAGVHWASSYDGAAARALAATEAVANGCYRLATMFGQSARNYGAAEAASGGVEPGVLGGLPWEKSVMLATGMGSAVGPGVSDLPSNWWLIQHTVGYVWPNGHQDRLRVAAGAWQSAARRIDGCAIDVMMAAAVFAQDTLPETDDMLAVCHEVHARITDLSGVLRELGQRCQDFAERLDEVHHQVGDALTELVEQSVVIQGIGAVAAVFSVGAAEVPTQALEATRVAAVAARVTAIIRTFVELLSTAAAAISALLERADYVAGAMLRIADMRLTTAVVIGVRATNTAVAIREIPALNRLINESRGLPTMTVAVRQMQKKQDHAKIFGLAAHYSKTMGVQYEKYLQDFVRRPDVVRIPASRARFDRKPAILSYDPNSKIIVIQHPDGSFWSCWKMNPKQSATVSRFGWLGKNRP